MDKCHNVIMMSGEESTKASYYRLMVYAALFGALSSLLTAGYITLYNQGVIFFGLPSIVFFNINLWPLILLSLAGLFIGLAIKLFGQHGGLGISSTPICSGRAPRLPQLTKHPSSSIYIIMEWCSSRS